jgi:hypothetical protein
LPYFFSPKQQLEVFGDGLDKSEGREQVYMAAQPPKKNKELIAL